jgi:hypothetical protein
MSFYICDFPASDASAAQRRYEGLVKLFEMATDWQARPAPAQITRGDRNAVEIGNFLDRPNWTGNPVALLISLKLEPNVHLYIGPIIPSVNPVPPSGTQSGGLRPPGQYMPLPPVAPRGSNSYIPPGMAVLIIKNQTGYDLQLTFRGPTQRQIFIPAGGSQRVMLAAGAYEELGRVTATNVLPFYGQPSYAAGFEYGPSEFYIGQRY